MEDVGGRVLRGRFVLDACIGQGAMGTVWRARDQQTSVRVAVKLLKTPSPAATTSFLKEIEALAELHHPNIVGYVDHGLSESGSPYLAMEWLEGIDLQAHLLKATLTCEELILVAQQIAAALRVAHGRGLVHRDLKPANIFLCQGSLASLKVLDFGVAKRLVESPKDGKRLAVGSPVYMSPEQARGLPDIDGRSDFFALGSVLYEAAAGVAPFMGETAMAVLAKVCVDEAKPLRTLCPSLTLGLEKLIFQLLSKQRGDRPADAEQLIEFLAKLDPAGKRDGVAFSDALSLEEQRIAVVLMCKLPRPTNHSSSNLRAVQDTREVSPANAVLPKALLDVFGKMDAQLNLLIDGTILITCTGAGSSAELAAKSARCGLAIKRHNNDATIAISIGKSVVKQGLPLGRLLDECSARLAGASQGEISVDEEMAPLVSRAFALRHQAGRWLLVDDSYATPLPVTTNSGERRLVGRDNDLAQLTSDYDHVCADASIACVAYVAEAGVGKTRLVSEWIARLRHKPNHRYRLWRAQGDALSSGAAYGFVKQLALIALGIDETTPRKARRPLVQAYLKRSDHTETLGDSAVYLSELIGASPTAESEAVLRGVRSDPRVLSEQMAFAFADALRIATDAAPLILLLDDLQWADAASVKLLETALKRNIHSRCFVLAMVRPEIETAHPGLWADLNLQRRQLAALDQAAAAQLILDLLPTNSAQTASWVAERADGNPFFIEELARTLRRRGRSEVPEAILGTVQARLDDLPAAARRILRAASVYGRHFQQQALEALLGGEDVEQLEHWLGLLSQEEVIVAMGRGVFRFWHELTREATYQTLTDGDRVLGHRLAGRWLEVHGDAGPAVLFEHATRACDSARSTVFAERAAELSYDSGDLEGALVFANRGLQHSHDKAQAGRFLYLEARCLRWLGRMTLARAPAYKSIELLPLGSGPWFNAIDCCAWIIGEGLDTDGLLSLAALASETLPLSDVARDARAMALASIAFPLMMMGRGDAAELLLLEAEKEVATALTSRTRCHLLAVRARFALKGGMFSRAKKLLEQGLNEIGRVEDQLLRLNTENHLQVLLLECGLYEHAHALLLESIESSKRLRSALLTGMALANIGLVEMHTGRLAQAESSLLAASDCFRDAGATWVDLGLGLYKAHLSILKGDLACVQPFVEPFLRDPTLVPPIRPYALALAAKCALLQNESDEALRWAEEGRRLIDDEGVAPDEGEMFLRLTLTEALLAVGHRNRAHALLLEVTGKIKQRASDMDDPAMATSYLNIPVHQSLVALLNEFESERTVADRKPDHAGIASYTS